MITSDQKAIEVQARYARSHKGLAPAVRRYLSRVSGAKGYGLTDVAESTLGLPISRVRSRPSVIPSSEPTYKIELRRWLVNYRKRGA